MAGGLAGTIDGRWLRRAGRGAAALALVLVAGRAGLLGIDPAYAQRLNIKRTYRILTTNTADQWEPAIAGDLIVFTDRRSGSDEDIWYYDLSTDAQGMVAGGPTSQRQPDVSGRTVVYTDFGPSTGGGDIYAVTLGGAPTLVAGEPASAQTDPAISGNLIVWEDRRDGNLEIYARDLGGGPAIRLTETADAEELDPAVSGSRVVYSRRYADGTCQIFMTDVVTRMTRQITSGAGCFSRPDIDGDMIAYDNNPSGDQDVYVYSLATGEEHRVVLAGVQRNAHVSGDWIAAEKVAQVPYPNWDIKIYNIPRDSPFGAVTTEFDEQADDISGTRVAYQTNQNHNLDIGVVEFQLVSGRNHPPLADAGPDQTIECASVAGAPMTLDGSASTDFDGDPITYAWTGPFPENNGLVPSVNPTVTLPLGRSTINLVVNDAQEDSAPDSMTASVNIHVQGLGAPLAALTLEGATAPSPAREFKQGSTLPLKLVLSCGAETLQTDAVAAPEIVAIDSAAGSLDPSKLDLDSGKANGGGLRFRSSEGGWVYNLSTRALRPGTYTIWIKMPDGRRYSAAVVLR